MIEFDTEPHTDCPSGKPGYACVKDANNAILRSWHSHKGSPKSLHPYECPQCGYLHLTHQENTADAKAQAGKRYREKMCRVRGILRMDAH